MPVNCSIFAVSSLPFAAWTARGRSGKTSARTIIQFVFISVLLSLKDYHSLLGWIALDLQIVEGGHAVSLGPQADLAGAESGIVMIEQKLAVKVGLDEIAHGDDPECVPLPKRRRLDCCGRQLHAPPVVVIKTEVVFQRVRADDVIFAVGEAKDDPARGVFFARDRLQAHPH